MKRTSIKDIAQTVGVSAATVSLVLTGKGKDGRVSKEMSEKIRNVARDLNYQPNRLAISLQSGRSQTIGLLVADISNPFFGTLAFYVQEEMEKAGYAVIIMNTDESDLQMERMIGLLKSHQVDGFIIVPTEFGESSIRQLVEGNIPLVLIDRYYPSLSTYNVLIDNYKASYTATRYLLDISCQKIALLVYDNHQPHMEERLHGYADALKEAGLYDDHLVKRVRYRVVAEDVRCAISELVEERKDLEGILFATNTIAMLGIKHLLKLNLAISRDLQVVCFDKSEAFDFMPVFIPHIHQPIAEMGRQACRLLLRQIKGEPADGPQICQLPARLVDTPE